MLPVRRICVCLDLNRWRRVRSRSLASMCVPARHIRRCVSQGCCSSPPALSVGSCVPSVASPRLASPRACVCYEVPWFSSPSSGLLASLCPLGRHVFLLAVSSCRVFCVVVVCGVGGFEKSIDMSFEVAYIRYHIVFRAWRCFVSVCACGIAMEIRAMIGGV